VLPDLPRTTPALGKLVSGPGGLGIRNQDVRPPGPSEVVIEVLGAGICGTDLHIADDEFPYAAPVTMGHEVTGTVVATGGEVDSGWEGLRVACETYFSYCGSCRHCRDGRPNLCDERRSIGSLVDGGFARWLTLPVRNLHRLPDHVGTHAGALAEPLACVAQCLFDPPVIDAGDRAMVTGPGTMGLLSAQAARAAGGEVTVIGLDRDRARLEVASRLGFEVLTPAQGEGRVVAPDVVLECSGAEAAAGYALEQVRKGGRYVQVGIFGGPVTLPVDQVLYKELSFTSGNASTPSSWNRAMRLLKRELVELDPLVGAVMPLSDWEEAFALTRAGTGLKVILDPRQE
jgi:L-iditol 2-dehydrogenase